MFYLGSSTQKSRAAEEPSPDWSTFYTQQANSVQDERLKAFYSAGVIEPSTPLSEVPFVALDFETTGFDPKRDGIVSIGLVPFDLRRIHCAGAKHWIVRPRTPLDKDSVVIHGITHSDIQSAPDLMRVLEYLLKALEGRIVVVHYRNIERAFLHAALEKRLHEGILFPVVDTMELEARVHRARPLGFWQKIRGAEPESIRLVDSRSRYNLPYYNQHHALTDALATAELLMAQIAYRFSPQTPISELWK
ncbi:DNA polymerase III subunit epsilon [Nitrincola sp. A-D6]|uniref:3'-5' exonuclease n=1 Tax=Nitrincola sp. A-D6 TaxID=1545442 RepID=UPI00051FD468|nr:3'-5' exonuclease [Nitrincola sp. A-D6]KGK41736.1 DNA polymerase III subunit epsilon [Nitrincola sp. A-D6]